MIPSQTKGHLLVSIRLACAALGLKPSSLTQLAVVAVIQSTLLGPFQLSQALMLIITVGFLCSDTLEQFWKTK